MDWIGCSANYKWAETFWGIGHLGFLVETRTDDGVQASWQGPFFSEITRPWILRYVV